MKLKNIMRVHNILNHCVCIIILFFCIKSKAQTTTDPDLLVWTHPVDISYFEFSITKSGIVIFNNTLIGELKGLDINSGKQIWGVELKGVTHFSLLHQIDLMVVQILKDSIQNQIELIGLDVNTGTKRWTHSFTDLEILDKKTKKSDYRSFWILQEMNMIIVKNFTQNQMELIGLDVGTGMKLWNQSISLRTLDGLKGDFLDGQGGIMTLKERVILWGSVDDNLFRIIGFDCKSGEVIWTKDYDLNGITKNAQVNYPIVLLPDSNIILHYSDKRNTERGSIVCINTMTGVELWKYIGRLGPASYGGFLLTDSHNGLPSDVPHLIGNYLITTTGAIDVRTGSLKWGYSKKTAGVISSMVQTRLGLLTVRAVLGPYGAFGINNDWDTQLIDPATGKGIWEKPVALRFLSIPILRQDTIFVVCKNGLTGLDLSTGIVLKEISIPKFKALGVNIKSLDNGGFFLNTSHSFIKISSNGLVDFQLSFGSPTGFNNTANYVQIPYWRNPENLDAVQTNDKDELGKKGIVIIDTENGREIGTVRRNDKALLYLIDGISKMAVAFDKNRVAGFKFRPLPK